jgi:PadR family transcriptional regulator PadR
MDNDLYGGLIRLLILQHAIQAPIFGLGVIEDLRRRGYKLSPGTIYPLLHGLERRGYLRSSAARSGAHIRRLYRTTAQGRRALEAAKTKTRELLRELLIGCPGGRRARAKRGN